MPETKVAQIVVRALFLTLLGTTGCTPTAPPVAGPQADLKLPPVGSSFVIANKNSGSFGADTGQSTWKFLGEQTWQGKKLTAFSDGTVTNYGDARRRLIATVRGTTPVESYEPYYTGADWPLFVGKSWPNRFRYTDHRQNRTFDNVQHDGKVEAYEDVKTPAGTFKAFKIVLGDQFLRVTQWYSPDLAFFIKTRTERLPGFFLPPGVRETELVSYDLKP